VKTAKGKWLPLDAAPVADDGVILLEQTLWGETTGRVVPRGTGTHIPHWATCPDADEHRRPGPPPRGRRRHRRKEVDRG
jgi:hypothetical protein